jgi:hypothetical protein
MTRVAFCSCTAACPVVNEICTAVVKEICTAVVKEICTAAPKDCGINKWNRPTSCSAARQQHSIGLTITCPVKMLSRLGQHFSSTTHEAVQLMPAKEYNSPCLL